MKKVLFVCTICLLTVVSFAQNCTFMGRATAPIFQNKRVFLLNANTGDVLDTASIADSSFTFTFPVKETFIGYVQVESNGSRNPQFIKFVAEPGMIKGDMVKGTLSGTPANDSYNKALEEFEYEESALRALVTEYRNTISSAKQEEIKSEYEKGLEQLQQNTLKMYQDNKGTALGALCLEYLIDLEALDYEELKKMVDEEAPIVQTYLPIKTKMSKWEKLYNTSVGKQYTDLDLTDYKTGKTVKLSQYINGKVALVDFWASWCRPCRAEIPNVANVYKKYGGDKFVVIGLNVWDEPQRQAEAIKAEKMTWPQLSDATKVATDTYGVDGIPQIMLIDKDGKILARDLRGDDIEEAVKNALK